MHHHYKQFAPTISVTRLNLYSWRAADKNWSHFSPWWCLLTTCILNQTNYTKSISSIKVDFSGWICKGIQYISSFPAWCTTSSVCHKLLSSYRIEQRKLLPLGLSDISNHSPPGTVTRHAAVICESRERERERKHRLLLDVTEGHGTSVFSPLLRCFMVPFNPSRISSVTNGNCQLWQWIGKPTLELQCFAK